MSIVEDLLLDIVVSTFPEVSESKIILDTPPKKELGDFAFNVFPYAKVTKLAPQIIAEKIAEGLKKHPLSFKEVSIMGGYVNFFLTNEAWMDIFQNLSTEDKTPKNETVVVDYIGANAGKPLHIGHICTPSIGQTILNIHEYLGYTIIGDSHFGDWGGIFGKLIFQWKFANFIRNEEEINDFFRLSKDENTKYSEILTKMQYLPPSDMYNNICHENNKLLTIRKENNGKECAEDFMLRLYYSYIQATYISEHIKEADELCRLEFKKLSE
jgi:arginyl-tRNA synthetase